MSNIKEVITHFTVEIVMRFDICMLPEQVSKCIYIASEDICMCPCVIRLGDMRVFLEYQGILLRGIHDAFMIFNSCIQI